jgi:hypothetical protein
LAVAPGHQLDEAALDRLEGGLDLDDLLAAAKVIRPRQGDMIEESSSS